MKFNELGFEPKVLEALDAMGFEKPTPIQQDILEEILN